MSLGGMQTAMFRLYLGSGVRQALREGDCSVLADLDLTSLEVEAIARLARERPAELDLFASTLRRKRAERYAALYALTARRVGDEWPRICADYVAGELSESVCDVWACLDQFRAAVERRLSSLDAGIALRDLLTIETAKIQVEAAPEQVLDGARQVAASGRWLVALRPPARVCIVQHPVRPLLAWATDGGAVPKAVPEPMHVIVYRPASGDRRVAFVRIGERLARALASADSRPSPLGPFAGARGPDGAAVRRALAPLVTVGAIDVIASEERA